MQSDENGHVDAAASVSASVDSPIRVKTFIAMQLHPERPQSWAVIDATSGAIALDGEGRMFTRLHKHEAEGMAVTMTKAL